jgi:predicted dehydrogenase
VATVVKDAAGAVRYEAPPLEELIRWRLWQRTGGGLMVELGSHQLDAASIFITAEHHRVGTLPKGEKAHPLCVSASATRSLFEWDREIEDHIHCLIEFPAPGFDRKDALNRLKKITVAYSSINGNGFGGYGEVVFGDKATLILEKEKEAMLFKESDTASKIEVTKPEKGGPTLDTQASPGAAQAAATAAGAIGAEVSRGYTEELEHWAWCIRNPAKENQPRCTPKVALGDAVIALTTNLAARKGIRIDFDETWFDPARDETPETDPKIAKFA